VGGEHVITIRQAAKKYKFSERAVRRWVKEEKIPVTMSGNRVYISGEWLENKLKRDGKIG
jgi:excisionase family DNA binding protein